MATIHIDASKTKEDLSDFINLGIIRRLQLQGSSDDLKQHIQSEIETRARGMFLWAKLMLGILQWQTTEDDIRGSLRNAPDAIDDMITEMLKVYSSMLKGKEPEEFNTVLAWLSCATRPLTLAEVDAILKRLSSSASRVLALERKFRDKYASLIDLIRDDGLSTATLQSSRSSLATSSVPETTRVVFAHASIVEYFKKVPGKFSKRKTDTPVGLCQPDAEYNILKTCLEVFVCPGEREWSKTSDTLQEYAKISWIHHMRQLYSETTRIDVDFIDTNGEIIQLCNSFFNNDNTVRRWCHNLPWDTYTENHAIAIVQCIDAWAQRGPQANLATTQSWRVQIKETPAVIFYPVARVSIVESLHGTWYPLESLAVVAQVRALIEGEDTLDCLPNQEKMPIDVITKALSWIAIEPNASWHRNVGICYRRSGHIHKAIEHFEQALQLDPGLVEARGGLAITLLEQGYYTKAIDLEMANAAILRTRLELAATGDQDSLQTSQELSISYETIANSYYMLKDEFQALKYWRKAVEIGCIRDETMWDYFTVLANSSNPSRWQEVMQVLHSLHANQNREGQNRLSKHILDNKWPFEHPPEFFSMAATAATKTGRLPFLIKAYEDATNVAASSSHLSVLVLQLARVKLHRDFQRDFAAAEVLIETIMDVASAVHDSQIEDLENCKRDLARDYGQICTRKALDTLERGQDGKKYARKVKTLLKSGVLPYDLAEKIVF
ncbi:hypothetical protein FB567DRAFT_619611, partial [Paraphoma chrysanthemicola]